MPIVVFMLSDFTFCQFFLRRETRKLMPVQAVRPNRNLGNDVRTKHDIAEHLVLSHLNMADGDTKAENLLKLELDRRANLGDLVREVLSVGDRRRELAGYGTH